MSQKVVYPLWDMYAKYVHGEGKPTCINIQPPEIQENLWPLFPSQSQADWPLVMKELILEGWEQLNGEDTLKLGDIVWRENPHDFMIVLGVAGGLVKDNSHNKHGAWRAPKVSPYEVDKAVEAKQTDSGTEITFDCSGIEVPGDKEKLDFLQVVKAKAAKKPVQKPADAEDKAKEVLSLENVTFKLLASQGWRERGPEEVCEKGDLWYKDAEKTWHLAIGIINRVHKNLVGGKCWTYHGVPKPTKETYLLKYSCTHGTGYTVRVTKKWVNLKGAPYCGCHDLRMIPEDQPTEDKE